MRRYCEPTPTLLNQLTVNFLRTTRFPRPTNCRSRPRMGINSPLYAETGAPNITVGSLFSFGGGSGRVVFTNNNFQFHDAANLGSRPP